MGREKNVRIRFTTLVLAVCMILGTVLGTIVDINTNYVKAEGLSGYDYSNVNVIPMKDSQWSIRDEGELNKAINLLKENYTELNKARMAVESISINTIEKDSSHINTLLRFELLRTQTIYLINLIEHQVENRDNIKLKDSDKEYMDNQVKVMVNTTKGDSYQNKFMRLHELYKECSEGQTSCGPRTEGSNGMLLGLDKLKLPDTGEDGDIVESDRERLLDELSTITRTIESTMDLTEPTNIGESGSQDRGQWLTGNASAVVERMKMMNLLISVYEGLGLTKDVTSNDGLVAKLQNNQNKLKQLVDGADLNIDTSIDDSNPTEKDEDNANNLTTNPLEDVDLNEISELVDKKTNDMSTLYKGLFAWTSSFTPFETNVNDPYIMTHLTKEERDAYNKYGQNRSVIYSAEGNKGVIKGLKEGVPYQFKLISLGEFLDKVEVKEMALFVKNQSTGFGELGNAVTDTTNSNPMGNASNGSTAPSEDKQEQKSEEKSGGIFNWFSGKSGNNDSNSSPNWFSIADNSNNEGAKPSAPKFVGPVYATSGSLAKEIWGVNDAGDRSVDNIFYKTADNLKELGRTLAGTNVAINRLKGNTMNMNYFLMYNTLKGKSQLAPAIEEDMNKPIYVDFLGNILTQSGYVIVPASANYTYYNYSDKLPAYNAMFLNSYPEVVLNEKQTYSLMDSIDREKMVYQKSRDGVIRVSKLDKDGTSIKEGFYSLPLQSKATFSTGSIVVNFMDDITMYKQSSDPFTLSDTTEETDKDLTFVNTGVIMKTINEGVERIVNLKKISGDGRGIDWQLLKDANLQNIDNKETRMLDSVTLAALAGTVNKSTDGQMSVVLNDYKSKDEQLRDSGGLTATMGELYEGFHNRFISSMGLNYLLYTPKNSESTVLGNLAQYGIQLMIMVTIVAIIIFLIGFVKALYQRDMVGVKGIFGSIVAITLISAFTLFAMDPLVDILYNKPAEWILKNNLPIYILEDIEQTYKDQDSTFFDKSDKKYSGGNSTITLEKLKNDDVEMLRKELTQTDETQSVFYLPTFDRSRLNIIGDKVFLQGKDLKIGVKDLMEISKVEDVIGPDLTLQLKSTYSGYGELAYYMPYFNILDSFVSGINSYTEEARPSYRLIQYRKGFTKSTGRAEDFFKSVVFISPDMLDHHVRSLMKQYQDNEITKDYYTNQYTLNKEKKNNGDINEYPEGTEDGAVVEPGNVDDIFGDSYFKEEILPISMSNELLQELSNINNIVMYLNYHSNMDFRDWLGLKKVLLIEPDEGLFPSNYHHVIKETKWYPDLTKYTDEELMGDIYEVNARTRDFVVDKIIPISGKVSDDTLIKVVSLYATMEFNKIFSGDGVKLYPKSIDLAGLSNEYTTKSIMIPQEQIFVGNSHRTALYLAKETGWSGLLLAFIDRFMYFIRMAIRIGVIKVILMTTPIIALYLYISKKNKYSNYLIGAIVSSVMITFLYLLELAWYNMAFRIVNDKGAMSALTLGLVPQMALTTIYIMLLKTIFSDLKNFGYNGMRDKAMRMVGAANGLSYDNLYEQVSEEFGNEDYYDGVSGLAMGGQPYGTHESGPYGSSRGYGSEGYYDSMEHSNTLRSRPMDMLDMGEIEGYEEDKNDIPEGYMPIDANGEDVVVVEASYEHDGAYDTPHDNIENEFKSELILDELSEIRKQFEGED